MANGGNSATIANAEIIVGGIGDDAVTLASAVVAGSVALGSGNDTLTLAAGSNSATVANLETLTGNSGASCWIRPAAAPAPSELQRGAGRPDRPRHDRQRHAEHQRRRPWRRGADQRGGHRHGGKQHRLAGEDARQRRQGGFAYQQDTGDLYYSSTGNFSGGGALVGIITTNGATPWTYDATKLIQV